MTQPVPATCRPPCSVLKVPRVVNVATDSLTGRLAREGAAGHAQRHQDGDADQEHGRQCVVAHCLPPLWYNHVHGSRADGHRGVDFRGCQEGRPRIRRLDGRPSRGLVRDDRARPQVTHRVHQRTQDGQAAQRASRGVRQVRHVRWSLDRGRFCCWEGREARQAGAPLGDGPPGRLRRGHSRRHCRYCRIRPQPMACTALIRIPRSPHMQPQQTAMHPRISDSLALSFSLHKFLPPFWSKNAVRRWSCARRKLR